MNNKQLLLKLLSFVPLRRENPAFEDLFCGIPIPHNPLALSDCQLEERYRAGHQHFTNEAFEKAQRIFLGLTRLRPLVSRYWLALGLTHYRLGEHTQASECYAYAACLDPVDALPHYYQGVQLARLGHDDQAINYFHHVRAIGSDELSCKAEDWLGRLDR